MPTTPMPPASIWYLDNSTVLLVALALLFAISFTSRFWAPRLRLAVRSGQMVGERTRAERIAELAIRFLGNPALIAGSLVTLALLVAALWPSLLSPYGPEEVGRTLQLIDGEVQGRPFAPSSVYPAGTDREGRDLLTRIIYGTQRTFVLCVAVAVLRLLIGGSLGAVAGWRGGAAGQQILSFGTVSSSIPSLLFAFVFILTIGPRLGFGVFLLGLGLTGWAELTNIVHGAVRWIRGQPYLDAAIALGSTPLHIARRHLLPNLAPQLIPAAALELSAVLLTLGELGFLGLFLGEGFFEYVPQVVRSPKLPEWAGMLSGTRLSIFNWPWLPITPAIAFMVAILGFNLLATGLRKWLDPFQLRGTPR